MYQLGELSERQRTRLGWAALILGSLALIAGIWWTHYALFPKITVVGGVEAPVVVDYFNWVPRGWFWKTLGHLVAFGGSQLMVVGAAFLWVLNQKMTWARATFAALLAWIELVLFFGVVPSEWLNLSQTDLDWSKERIALTVPAWLVLGNELKISLAALKDGISMGYHVVMLGAAAVVALALQSIGKKRPAAPPPTKLSPYGRPLVKGGE